MADQDTEQQASDEAAPSAEDDWAAALSEQAAGEPPEQADAPAAPNAAEAQAAPSEPAAQPQGTGQDDGLQRAEFKDLDKDPSPQGKDSPQLDMILDIPVTIALEIGRTRVSIRNLLQLNQGSIVELDRLAGEPLDVLVNGTLIAHGEVVMVNEKFGIRLTDVISPAQRVQNLK